MNDNTGAASPPYSAARRRALLAALKPFRDEKDFDRQRIFDLSTELRSHAARELSQALREDGASDKGVEIACSDIAFGTALFKDRRRRNVDPYKDLAALREPLNALSEALDRLTGEAQAILEIRLREAPILRKGLLSHSIEKRNALFADLPPPPALQEAYIQLRAALPRIVRALPSPRSRRGGKDPMLHDVIHYSCRVWFDHTGQYPTTTKAKDGKPAAPLFRYFQGLLIDPNEPFTAGVWEAVLDEVRKYGPLPSVSRKPGRKRKTK